MPSSTAAHLLKLSPAEFDKLLDDGSILHAWDLGTGAFKRAIRVLAVCVMARQQGQPQPKLTGWELETAVYGGPRAHFETTELASIWATTTKYFTQLIGRGQLPVIKDQHKGRGGSAHIAWDTAVRFLHERRVKA